jgi:type I restriction enzyme S subunit
MTTLPLGDIVIEVKPGFASGKSDQDGVRQIRMNNVEPDGSWNWEKERLVPPPKNLEQLLVEEGDILFNATNSADMVGKTALAPRFEKPTSFSNHFMRLRLDRAKAHPSYVARAMQYERQRGLFTHIAKKWVNQAAVSREDLLACTIPLPPLEEQKRIAGILDQAAELCRLRTRALDKLNTLGQAIFHEMFGGIQNSKYPKAAFGEFAEIKLGKMLDKGKFKGRETRPYLRNVNVRWFHFDLRDVLEMEFEESETDRFTVRNGDLMICEGGEPGRCAVWQGGDQAIFYQKALHRARLDLNRARPDFVAFWFYLAASSGQLSDFVSAATIAHLTGAKIKQLPIMLPPLPDQIEFESRLREIGNEKTRHKEAVSKANALFASLQHRAFRGEL